MFNGSGTFDRPIADYVFDTTISETDVNAEMDGIAAGLSSCVTKDGQTTTTAVVPFAQGIKADTVAENSTGSGVTLDGVLAKDGRIDTNKGTDIASAATTDIWSATGNFVHITGTVAITSFGTASKAGLFRLVEFDGALTLTHGANLDCPGSADITTAAGDRALIVANTTTAARVLFYQRKDGTAVSVSGLNINGLTEDTDPDFTADYVPTYDVSASANKKAKLSALIFPAGVVAPFAGSAAPTGWLFCYGQAVSRTTYATLFTAISTTYGSGDGTTTFNLPDLRGRVVAGHDNMGGTSANRLTGVTGSVDGDVLGGTGGEEAHTLTSGELAAHTHDGSSLSAASGGAHTHTLPIAVGISASSSTPRSNATASDANAPSTDSGGAHTHTVSGNTGSTGSGTAHNNVQPTLILNYIIKT